MSNSEAPAGGGLEIRSGEQGGTSMSFSPDKTPIGTGPALGSATMIDMDAKTKEGVVVGLDAALEAGQQAKEAGEPANTEDGIKEPPVEAKEGDEPADEPAALPEWNPAEEASVAAYDARYTMPDPDDPAGEPVLNLDAFIPELEANMVKAEGAKAELNPASYDFLKARFGVSRQSVDTFIAGQIALKVQAEGAIAEIDTRLDAMVGDEAAVKSMTDWASANLTQAQKDRFNEAMRNRLKDPDAAEAQVAWLAAKHKAAAPATAPKAAAAAEEAPKPQSLRRGVKPAVSATAGAVTTGGSGGAKPYATEAEYHADLKAAGSDDAKLDVTRARMRASDWFRASQG